MKLPQPVARWSTTTLAELNRYKINPHYLPFKRFVSFWKRQNILCINWKSWHYQQFTYAILSILSNGYNLCDYHRNLKWKESIIYHPCYWEKMFHLPITLGKSSILSWPSLSYWNSFFKKRNTVYNVLRSYCYPIINQNVITGNYIL